MNQESRNGSSTAKKNIKQIISPETIMNVSDSPITNETPFLNPNKENLDSFASSKHDCALQIIDIAMAACTAGEKIGINNKRRFCYKNIQHICSKTKEHLRKSDMVVVNAKSQGIPWIVKNFIFSFLRMLDGWKCLKMILLEKYVNYNRIESKYYSPQIRETFYDWQTISKDMMYEIYKIFMTLDQKFQLENSKAEKVAKIYPTISTNCEWLIKSDLDVYKFSNQHIKIAAKKKKSTKILIGNINAVNAFNYNVSTLHNEHNLLVPRDDSNKKQDLSKKFATENSIDDFCGYSVPNYNLDSGRINCNREYDESNINFEPKISNKTDADWEIAKRAASNLVDSYSRGRESEVEKCEKMNKWITINRAEKALRIFLDSDNFLMILGKCHSTENPVIQKIKCQVINQLYSDQNKIKDDASKIFQVLIDGVRDTQNGEILNEIYAIRDQLMNVITNGA